MYPQCKSKAIRLEDYLVFDYSPTNISAHRLLSPMQSYHKPEEFLSPSNPAQ